MIPFNENWERWCKISIIHHFNYNCKDQVPVFAETFPKKERTLSEYLEVRVDGPYGQENVKDQWRFYFEVNVLVVVKIDPGYDPYRINRLTGLVAKHFSNDICVRKYGDTEPDDQTLIGHLSLIQRGAERIQVSHFGQIRPDTEIVQASVEGHYEIYFD